MEQERRGAFLRIFGEASMGDAEKTPVDTQQANETGGEQGPRAPDAGEAEKTGRTRKEAFRALMEGEYKDLFTAYFQEAFNRRFRDQKEMREELERARAVVKAAAERFGPRSEAELAEAIRADAGSGERDGGAAEALETAVREARADAAREVLDSIRARGMRPAENALQPGYGTGGAASRMSRAQREELARRAAMGERIEF